MIFFPLQKTSTNGWVKIHHAPCVQCQLHSATSSLGARWTSLKDDTPGDKTKSWSVNSGKQRNNHQCLATQTDQFKHTYCIFLRGRTIAQQLPPKDQVSRDGAGSGQADVGRHWPVTDRTTADSCHQPEAWSGPVVQHAAQGVRCWAHSSLGGCCSGSLWKEEKQILRLQWTARVGC